MKAVVYITLLLAIISFNPVYAIVPDYLTVHYTEVNPESVAEIGQLVNARIELKGSTPIPDEARLNISTGIERPRIEVNIDGDLKLYGDSEFEILLPSDGVEYIEIIISFGLAPKVTKQTIINLLDVKTFVKFKGEEGVYQNDGQLSLAVSNIIISEALNAIDNANYELSSVEKALEDLNSIGIDTAALDYKLNTAKDLVKTAETLYEKDDIELSKNTADSAIIIMDEIMSDTDALKDTVKTKNNLFKYGLIGFGLTFFAIVLFLLMKKREELG